MKPAFSIVLVNGGGSRVLRFCVPRWITYGTLGSVAAVVAAAVGVTGYYAFLRQEDGQMVALRRRVDDQRELIDSFQTQVTAVRSEIMEWKALHSQMWEALGPETGPEQTPTGVGGGTPDAEAPTASVEPRLGGELELLATTVAEEGPRLRELERVISRTGRLMSALPLRWPVRGPVKSEYGLRHSPWNGAWERHPGIDIGSPPGTPVTSPAPGRVVAASSQGGYGKHVTLAHGNGVKSRYAHLKQLDVKLGQRIEKGQVIGLVGSTGRSTGPHLHYEVLVEGKRVDPRGFLWEQ